MLSIVTKRQYSNLNESNPLSIAASRELRAKIELMRTELDVRETVLILVTHDPHIARHLADKTLTLSSAAKE
jgi:ABC-type lipoprotein export system ATPase subunit